ncbi:collagen alpha-1(I) chain-like [Muntiacus reevesi]|uniref:collagen alpha-1(I) chain-like n=1 Tax=Muntiacus reevesi TaxID=9886 RepID=UPI003306C8CD
MVPARRVLQGGVQPGPSAQHKGDGRLRGEGVFRTPQGVRTQSPELWWPLVQREHYLPPAIPCARPPGTPSRAQNVPAGPGLQCGGGALLRPSDRFPRGSPSRGLPSLEHRAQAPAALLEGPAPWDSWDSSRPVSPELQARGPSGGTTPPPAPEAGRPAGTHLSARQRESAVSARQPDPSPRAFRHSFERAWGPPGWLACAGASRKRQWGAREGCLGGASCLLGPPPEADFLMPRWDEVEAVGALLPEARAALPRSPLRGGPASTPSLRLQPWTGSLFPQKPADSPVSPLGTRGPSGSPGPGSDTFAKHPTGGAPPRLRSTEAPPSFGRGPHCMPHPPPPRKSRRGRGGTEGQRPDLQEQVKAEARRPLPTEEAVSLTSVLSEQDPPHLSLCRWSHGDLKHCGTRTLGTPEAPPVGLPPAVSGPGPRRRTPAVTLASSCQTPLGDRPGKAAHRPRDWEKFRDVLAPGPVSAEMSEQLALTSVAGIGGTAELGLGLAALPVDARRPGIIGHLEVGREPAEWATCPRRPGVPPPLHLSPPLLPPARPSGPAAAPSLPGTPPSRPLSEFPSHQLCLLLAGTGLGRRLALGSVLETSLGGGRGPGSAPRAPGPTFPPTSSEQPSAPPQGPHPGTSQQRSARVPQQGDGGGVGPAAEAPLRVCVHACAHVCLCKCLWSPGPAAARASRALDGKGLTHAASPPPSLPHIPWGEPGSQHHLIHRDPGLDQQEYLGQDRGGDSRAVVGVGQAAAADPVSRTYGQPGSQAQQHPAVPGIQPLQAPLRPARWERPGGRPTCAPGRMGGLTGASCSWAGVQGLPGAEVVSESPLILREMQSSHKAPSAPGSPELGTSMWLSSQAGSGAGGGVQTTIPSGPCPPLPRRLRGQAQPPGTKLSPADPRGGQTPALDHHTAAGGPLYGSPWGVLERGSDCRGRIGELPPGIAPGPLPPPASPGAGMLLGPAHHST